MNREALIEILVATGHLNVPDRRTLQHVRHDEVFAAVRTLLEREGCFPPGAKSGGFVYEGPQIRPLSDGRYIGVNQRASVFNPAQVAERIECRFESIDEAVNWYIAEEWRCGIDGIPIT